MNEKKLIKKKAGYILAASVIAGVIFWIVDSLLGCVVFHTGRNFWDLFILNIPPHAIFARTAFAVTCLIGGLIASNILRNQRESEKALLESEAYYRSLLQCMHESILVIDRNYRITDANRKFSQETGYNREHVIHRTCHKISHGYDLPCSQCGEVCPLEMVMETREPRQCRHEHLRADGTREWVDILMSPLMDEQGNVTHVIQAIRDVSDQIEVEKALLESEFRYLSLFQSSQEAIFLLKNDVVTDCNPATEHLFKCDLDEIIGNSVFQFCPDVQPDGTPSKTKGTEFVRLTVNGAPQRFEWTFQIKDGKMLDVEISLSQIHIGGESHLLTMVWDIGDLKKAQEILKQERKRLANILDGSPVPSFVIDMDHRVVHWNRSCEFITGVSREYVLDKPLNISALGWGEKMLALAELILRMSDEEILEKYKHIRKNDTYSEAFEVTGNVLMNGEERIMAILATRLRNSKGRLIGAIQCAQDITEKEQLYKQLLQSQKMEAIGTLAGGIAHDFNNMLFPIIGYSEMALTKIPEDNPAARYLAQVYKAANRAKDLVQQILTFSRKTDQERKPLRIKPVVKEALKLLRASIPSSVEMVQDVDNDDTVLADPVQIHQLIMNLCTNAYHAMGPRGGKLGVALKRESVDSSDIPTTEDLKGGEYLRLTISDTGAGMNQEILKRVFEPFFTTKGPGEGTGMGLAVVHGILKNHGGFITASSEIDKGSDFHVYFPIHERETTVEEIPAIANVPRGNEHVLLVDDEEQITLLIREILENLGYKVTGYRNSIEALEVFRNDPQAFDIVITDQTMPNMQGIELAGEFLKIRQDIPIILCTGYKETGTREIALKAGIRDVFTKPVSRSALAGIIRKALDRKEN